MQNEKNQTKSLGEESSEVSAQMVEIQKLFKSAKFNKTEKKHINEIIKNEGTEKALKKAIAISNVSV